MLIKPENNAHWYDAEGRPQHHATLREARKEGLRPSVTTILKDVLVNRSLERWKQEQAILAALTLPRQDKESLEEFARRVVEDARAQASVAAEWGTRIHQALENHLEGYVNQDSELGPWIREFSDLCEANALKPIATEQVVVHPVGFAGTCDLLAEWNGVLSVIDYKSQNVRNKHLKRGVEPNPQYYDTWLLQLEAYRQTYLEMGYNPQQCVSIVIDSNKPQFFYKAWDDLDSAWKQFRLIFDIWKLQKNYDPAGSGDGES